MEIPCTCGAYETCECLELPESEPDEMSLAKDWLIQQDEEGQKS